ncbi:MAG: FecR domain-containing protein [Acidobacteriota bacterium]
MRHATVAGILSLAVVAAAPSSNAPTPLTYEVTAIKHKLFLEEQGRERTLQQGDHATSGDALRTGWRATAELAVPARAAFFHLGSSSRFRLAHDRPGVLLELERGRLRAVFGPEKPGDGTAQERLVTTPSAVLSVRGTQYGVEVAKNGETSLVVFEGVVEVTETSGIGGPVQVRAGETCRVRSGKPPSAPQHHQMSPQAWDRGSSTRSPGQGSSMQQQDGTARQPGGTTGQGSSKSSSGSGKGGSKGHG